MDTEIHVTCQSLTLIHQKTAHFAKKKKKKEKESKN